MVQPVLQQEQQNRDSLSEALDLEQHWINDSPYGAQEAKNP